MTTKAFKEVLKQIYCGNGHALEQIYQEYYQPMVNTANYILKNKQDSEDAAADVIYKIFKMAIKTENPNIEDAGAYVKVSIKNSAINIYNKRKKFLSIDFIEKILIEKDFSDISINNIEIENSLNTLSEIDKQIVNLYYIYDCKIKIISTEMNMPVGTIKWRLSKIRKELKK